MKAEMIKRIAEKYGSVTLRFATIYDNGVIVRMEQNRRLIDSDVVRGEGDLQRLVVKGIRKLANGMAEERR